MTHHDDGTYSVLYLDHGDNGRISEDDITFLPVYLSHLPCQAIECRLYGVDYTSTLNMKLSFYFLNHVSLLGKSPGR